MISRGKNWVDKYFNNWAIRSPNTTTTGLRWGARDAARATVRPCPAPPVDGVAFAGYYASSLRNAVYLLLLIWYTP